MELLHPLPFISLYFLSPLQQLQGFVQILDTIIGVINVFCICISFSFSPVARFKCYSNNVVKNLKDDLVLLQHFVAKDLHKSIFIYLGFFLSSSLVNQNPGDFFSSRTAAAKSVFSLFDLFKP